jgi:hypothetical protein
MIIIIITVFRLAGVTSRGPGHSTHGETLGKKITRSLLTDGQDTLGAAAGVTICEPVVTAS